MKTYKRKEVLSAIRKLDFKDGYCCPVQRLTGRFPIPSFFISPSTVLSKRAATNAAKELLENGQYLAALSCVYEATAPKSRVTPLTPAYREWLCNWVKATFPREVSL